ncbi:MAG: ATP-binding protein [Candidatus Shapirobacteria bacterium]|nr:ATP-binding protein [Candidatus Shapirobacteria bacterium]MDD5073569.1 ATP-binding protein [Candidatus Shapirobacteria bacterium]MDD5481322.1 ATP-binding protein [Candidatus Shapirobacteria bacterium]
MKIAVVSGKGGVGKSMLASSLCFYLVKNKRIVAVDGDVDAPNLHLWLGQDERWDKKRKISVFEKPVFDLGKCTGCGKCAQICAFGAIIMENGRPNLNKFICEGCGACEEVCPVGAIKMRPVVGAEVRIKNDVFGFPLVSAQLLPGQTGSGKVVDEALIVADQFSYQTMVIDAPAGTGCPIIAVLKETDFAILVTEPTPSGFADLKRVLGVVDHFGLSFGVVVNKWDLNPTYADKVIDFAGKNFLGKITYDQKIFSALSALKPIMTTDLPAKKEMEEIFNSLSQRKVFGP